MSKSVLAYASHSRKTIKDFFHRLGPMFRVIVVVFVLILGLLAWYVHWRYPWVWYGSRDSYQRHRMLAFTIPDGQVVYEEQPERAAGLAALSPDPRAAYVGDPKHAGRRDLAGNGDYRRWPQDSYAQYVPPFFVSLFTVHGPPCLVFVHERISASARRRMVLVTQDRHLEHRPPTRPSEDNVRMGIYINARSDPVDQAFQERGGNYRRIYIPLRPEAVMRVFAGQPDLHDTARFTVRYEIDDRAGTIEGRLEADDTVSLRVLDGPAATQPSH